MASYSYVPLIIMKLSSFDRLIDTKEGPSKVLKNTVQVCPVCSMHLGPHNQPALGAGRRGDHHIVRRLDGHRHDLDHVPPLRLVSDSYIASHTHVPHIIP